MMARASIILGIMGCDQPQTLDPRVRKSTALSLTILLSDVDLDTNNSENNTLSTGSMARTLSSMELLSQGFKTWENYINAAEVLRTLFMYATNSQPMMALISRGAKAAIFQISITNMPLVISTLTFDTAHAKSLEDRLRCLKIIGIFIKKVRLLHDCGIVINLPYRSLFFCTRTSIMWLRLSSKHWTLMFLICGKLWYNLQHLSFMTW